MVPFVPWVLGTREGKGSQAGPPVDGLLGAVAPDQGESPGSRASHFHVGATPAPTHSRRSVSHAFRLCQMWFLMRTSLRWS